ncbi:MAG: VWA domain-containing protein [Propionibacteriaceae bacterium]
MRTFPFSAVVGSDDLALALLLSTVSPEIGGVLVRGEKGTAKSTMVRALAAVLPAQQVVAGCRFGCDPTDPDPQCPDGPHTGEGGVPPVGITRAARLVELPVGATEDRVIGSLDLEQALGRGATEFSPGLLAAAHRGILYVDEVNLLHDHLVDLLLDAAAMGRSVVEREGVSVTHAARMVLVGTMNPEEGELRPQLLDRFGLTVEVAAPRDPAPRAEVVRRRLAYDLDPDAFAARFADAETALRERILDAQHRLAAVELSDDALSTIARVCSGFEVDGLRADIVTARAAIAHAAWHRRTAVTRTDIRAAARLALPHRRRRNPFDAPGLDEDLLDALLGEAEPEPESPPPTPPDDDPTGSPAGPDQGPAPDGRPGGDDGRTDRRTDDRKRADDHPPTDDHPAVGAPAHGANPPGVARVADPYRTKLITATGVGRGEAGRRSRALTRHGRTVGAALPTPGEAPVLHLMGTVQAAAPHQQGRGRVAGSALRLHRRDLRTKITEGREANLVLLCVDASGSMAARQRMEAVKTAALSLLLDAYQRRDKVGLVTFRGAGATLALPPTSSVDTAARRLAELPSGGRTPLAEGLICASETLRRERIRDPRRRPLLVVITDGRATSGTDAVRRSQQAADFVRTQDIATVVIDCETGRFSMGLAHELAVRLGAQHLPVGEVAAETIVDAVAHGHAPGQAA